MFKNHLIYLFLFFVFITRFDLYKCQEEGEAAPTEAPPATEETPATEAAAASEAPPASEESPATEGGGGGAPPPTEKSSGDTGSGGAAVGGEGDIGANDGKCECCDGEGIVCGLRMKWCGATGCDINNLYYCDKNNKKAYEYEQCKHICITHHKREYPDYCSIKIDSDFFYVKKQKFDEIKKEFNNRINDLNQTARANLEKLKHSLDISPEEKAAAIKKQEQEAKEAKDDKSKPAEATEPATEAAPE